MDQVKYREILAKVMPPYANAKMQANCVYQHDNEPKHTVKSVKKWLLDNKMRIMEWPAQ